MVLAVLMNLDDQRDLAQTVHQIATGRKEQTHVTLQSIKSVEQSTEQDGELEQEAWSEIICKIRRVNGRMVEKKNLRLS